MRTLKKLLFFALVILGGANLNAQYVQPMRYTHYSFEQNVNIGVGTARVTDPSAYLEVGPTSNGVKGFLPPRTTTTLRNGIASPAAGLFVYNTTTGRYNFYSGSSWLELGLNIDTAGKWVNTIFRIPGRDSIYFNIGGVVHAIKDSTGGGGGISNVKNSIEIDADSAQLVNDEDEPGAHKVYRTDETGTKGWGNAAVIDTTGRYDRDSSILIFDTTTATHKYVPYPTSTGGGGCYTDLCFEDGYEYAPPAGDSIIVNDGFIGKFLIVWINGVRLHPSEVLQNYSDTLELVDTLPVDYKICIEVKDTTCLTHLALQIPADTLLLDDEAISGEVIRAWSLRKLRTGVTNCVQVERDDDFSTYNVGFFSNGDFDSTTYIAGKTGANGLARIWYDQSVVGSNATQVSGSQVNFENNAISDRWGLVFNGSNPLSTFSFTDALSGTGAKAVFVVYKNTNTGTYATSLISQSVGSTTGTWFALQVRTTGGSLGNPYFSGYAADLTDGVSADGDPHLGVFQYDGADGFVRRDGAQVATGALSLNTTATAPRIATDASTALYKGIICEIIICNTDAATILAAIEANINAYYGIY